MNFWQLSASEIAQGIKARQMSAQEVLKAHLRRLDEVNPKINAVVQQTSSIAMEQAEKIDKKVKNNEELGMLAGVPVTVKINIDQKNYATTNGARVNQHNIAKEDSPIVKNFINADAIIIGRTNAPAFSLRWFTNNEFHGRTLNPHNSLITPGGSSGGASAAVAAGICPIAHGTDIAGSIRYPAYACGIHGIRPSFGKVPTYNATTGDRYIGGQLMAVSGPLARTVDDLRIALNVLSKGDLRDPWYISEPKFDEDFKRTVAISPFPNDMPTNASIVNHIRSSAAILEKQGWKVEEVECPSFSKLADINLKLWMAETTAMKDLIYEEKDPHAIFVYEHMKKKCGTLNLTDIMECIKERSEEIRVWTLFLKKYSLLICPISSSLPFHDQLDVKSEEAFDEVLNAQLTQLGLPVLGFPGLSLATGIENSIPLGIQLISNRFREDIIFKAGAAIERELYMPQVATI